MGGKNSFVSVDFTSVLIVGLLFLSCDQNRDSSQEGLQMFILGLSFKATSSGVSERGIAHMTLVNGEKVRGRQLETHLVPNKFLASNLKIMLTF